MLYHYTAIDRQGVVLKGEREAEDEKSLARSLRQEGFLLTGWNINSGIFALKHIFSKSLGWVSLVDKMMFARNLAVMIGAGLSMNQALEALETQTKNKIFKEIIADLRKSITKGLPFSQALAKHRKVFGDFFIHMIEAGEASGKLEGSLKLLAKQMKRDHDLRSKVRGAMIYPAVVMTALVAIGVLMMIYVVPTLTQTFKDLGVSLPPTTKFILGLSSILQNYGLWAAGVLVILVYILYKAGSSRRGMLILDRVLLRLPIFGALARKLNVARMTRTLASLIGAGLSITKSLEITAAVLGNSKFRDSLARASSEIEKGRSLSDVLREFQDLYPPLVTEMVSVGEGTGTIVRMLIRVALFYEEDIDNTTKNLSSIVEPLMMLVIGTAVGFFAISMIQPLYSSLAGIK